MKKSLLMSTAFLLSLGIGAAQAANTNSSSGSQNQATSSSSSDQSNSDQSSKMNMRQNIHDALSKQGYTDIQVMPSSFMVEAKNSKGQPVAMVIGPDSMTEVIENKSANNSSNESGQSNSGSQNKPKSSQ